MNYYLKNSIIFVNRIVQRLENSTEYLLRVTFGF